MSTAPSVAMLRSVRCESMETSASCGRARVVELVPEVGMAAGRLSQLPGEWFQAAAPGTELRRFEHESAVQDVALDGRQLVVIVRDAHRHQWERA